MFWAPYAIGPLSCLSCLSVLSVLSVLLVYRGQTVGWIKMQLGMQVSLGPGHIVSDGDPAPPPQRDTYPHQFSVHISCGQMAGWIKMSLGMEVGLCPGDFVLNIAPNFWPMSWPNGWMDQDGTWHGGGPRSRTHSARWGPSSPPIKGAESSPRFSVLVYIGTKRLYVSGYNLVRR